MSYPIFTRSTNKMSNACLCHFFAKTYQMPSAGVYCSDIEHMGQFLLGQVRHTKNRISARPMRCSSQYPKNNTLLSHKEGIGKPKRANRVLYDQSMEAPSLGTCASSRIKGDGTGSFCMSSIGQPNSELMTVRIQDSNRDTNFEFPTYYQHHSTRL